MSAFITPIAVAIASTLIFVALMAKLVRSRKREKLGTATMLVGTWMILAGGASLYIAERITLDKMSYDSLVTLFVVSAAVTALGIVTFALGLAVSAWRASIRAVEHDHVYNRARTSVELASIDGGLASTLMPSTVKAWSRHRPEPVEADWSHGDPPSFG